MRRMKGNITKLSPKIIKMSMEEKEVMQMPFQIVAFTRKRFVFTEWKEAWSRRSNKCDNFFKSVCL